MSNDRPAKKRKLPEIPRLEMRPAEVDATRSVVRGIIRGVPPAEIPPGQQLPPSQERPGSPQPAPSPPTPQPLAEQPPSPQSAPSYEQGGYWRRENYVDDQLARTLDAYSQAVLNQLLRLAWGYHRDWCHVGLPKLAERCGFSVDRARKSKALLLARGLIEIIGEDNDNPLPDLRGTTYRVKLPPPPLRQQGGSQQQPPCQQPPNKERALKEQLEKVDASHCPDCFGSGMWYPGGFEKGVARCAHKRLA